MVMRLKGRAAYLIDIDGKVVHTKLPHPRIPIEEYLQKQGRFAPLFKPQLDEALFAELQAKVDAYW